jgi:hypothetical protein
VHVDRQRFLLLATALAGCGGSEGPAPEPIPIATAEPLSDDPQLVEPGGTEGEDPGPADEGLPPEPLSMASGMCRATNVVRQAGARCDDSKGHPAACSGVNITGGCASFPFICDQCESYRQNFKPRVAERAVACVIAQNKGTSGEPCATYACGDAALSAACIDPSADAECRAIASACHTSLDECRGLLSGMNATGRAKVATCAAQGCSYGIWSCIESMQ